MEGWHHPLSKVVEAYFDLFIHAIQNDYACNSAISSRYLATGIWPPQKNYL